MASIRSESKIEKLPEKYKGLYLRGHPKGIFGNPDFGNKKRKIVVFIDGCFWHGCPKHGAVPKSNVEFWAEHLGETRKRDEAVNVGLMEEGWKMIRVWECELKRGN